MIRFKTGYFTTATLLFIIEIVIGACMHDSVIRPYGGDFLVVIFLYCLVKSLINKPVLKVALGVLLFAYAVEVSQYFHLIELSRLQHSAIARLILGTSFSFTDLLAYTLGIISVILVEKIRHQPK